MFLLPGLAWHVDLKDFRMKGPFNFAYEALLLKAEGKMECVVSC